MLYERGYTSINFAGSFCAKIQSKALIEIDKVDFQSINVIFNNWNTMLFVSTNKPKKLLNIISRRLYVNK